MLIANDILNQKAEKGFVSVPKDATIFEASQKMVENKIGAILIVDKDEIIGIWTERDLLGNILDPDFDPRKAHVGTYMSFPLYSAPHDTSLEKLEEMFLGLFIRHILIRKNEKYIGLVSIGDVMRTILIEKDREIKALNNMASWEYYENWGWHRKYIKKKK